MPDVWTEEIVEALRAKARIPSHSFRSIATDLNIEFGLSLTRCSVSGKIARMGISKANPVIVKRRDLPPVPQVRKRRAVNGGEVNVGGEAYAIIHALRRRAAEISGNEPPRPAAPETFQNRVGLMDARADQCRWPAADDGTATMVCGEQTVCGSYCAAHYVRVWRPARTLQLAVAAE